MGIDCYYNPLSAPCRSVLLLAKHLGVSMNLKLINLMAGEQMTPEFLRMNPMHQIPTLDEDGFYMYDSRAILQYLANAYGNDSIYPKNPRKRFIVDQRLMFDGGELYQSFANAFYGKAFAGKKIEPENVAKVDAVLGHVNAYLTSSRYIAGDHLTIADFAVVASLSTMEACGVDIYRDWAAIKPYMELCKAEMVGYRELNQQGADQFGQFILAALQKP